MKPIIVFELCGIIALVITLLGFVARREELESSKKFKNMEFFALFWLFVDTGTYAFRADAISVPILWALNLIAYLCGSVTIMLYSAYMNALIREKGHDLKRWILVPYVAMILNMLIIIVSFARGEVVVLQDGFYELAGGLPFSSVLIQIAVLTYIIIIARLNAKSIGNSISISIAMYGIVPVLVNAACSYFGIADFSVPAAAILIAITAEILQNSNVYKNSKMRSIELSRALESAQLARAEADRANAAKGLFLANMSHEIRTPINAVLGMDTMILRRSKDREILKYAKDIQGAGNSLLSIINDILDFSKIESGKMELHLAEYDFSSLINDIHNIIGAKTMEKGLAFSLEVDEEIPSRFFGDDVRIRQVLINLLTNAVKYTPSGSVTLKIARNDEDILEKGKECSIHFSVKDTGIGIKHEDISKLTEEFVRIEESRNRNIEGTGLGINIVVSLLDMMGSKLEVSSVYGEGSDFYFDLSQPVVNSEKIGDINDRIKQIADGEKKYEASFKIPEARLLVVDDNAMNLSVFSNLLSDLECEIEEATSGFTCLNLVKEKHYDIIFLDDMMPKMDGVETFRRMHMLEDYPNAKTPVVILTANAISGAKEAYLAQGFAGYLSKPIDADKLEKMVENLISPEKKMPVSAKVAETEADTACKMETEADTACKMETEADTACKTETEAGDTGETGMELPPVDGINWEHALTNLRDMSLVQETVECFAETATEEMDALRRMYEKLCVLTEEANFKSYRIQGHSMKSSLAIIGADFLAEIAKNLEYAARDLDKETIDLLMPYFEKQWKRVASDLVKVLDFNKEK